MIMMVTLIVPSLLQNLISSLRGGQMETGAKRTKPKRWRFVSPQERRHIYPVDCPFTEDSTGWKFKSSICFLGLNLLRSVLSSFLKVSLLFNNFWLISNFTQGQRTNRKHWRQRLPQTVRVNKPSWPPGLSSSVVAVKCLQTLQQTGHFLCPSAVIACCFFLFSVLITWKTRGQPFSKSQEHNII